MNRDKDFLKKGSGVLVNKNTKDFQRAKRRNKVMKTAVSALGDDGVLANVSKQVKDITNAPSRAEERVQKLELELAENKKVNEEMQKSLAKMEKMIKRMEIK